MTRVKATLDEAVRALREEGAGDAAVQRFTRARVMASLHQGRVTRRTRLAFLLPIAATFVATSAWGVSSGRASAWLDELRETFGVAEPAPVRASTPANPPVAKRGARPKPPVEPSIQRVERPLEAEDMPPAVEERAAVRATPSASSARLDAELELYKLAHRAHFTGGDPAAALAAWDAYLRKAPSGRFALEARYNRALCLVRLERRGEARAALEPFARGVAGDYRKREAAELYDALGP